MTKLTADRVLNADTSIVKLPFSNSSLISALLLNFKLYFTVNVGLDGCIAIAVGSNANENLC